MTDWYLIQVKPNAQHIAERNLKRQGCTVFLPLSEETRKLGPRFVTKHVPLFPGYLFLGLTASAPPWRSVNATQGVSRCVSLDGTYRPLPSGLIAELQKRCDQNGVYHPQDTLLEGEIVRIETGPLAGVIAEIESIAPERRAWVLIDLMGQSTRIAVEQGCLRRA